MPDAVRRVYVDTSVFGGVFDDEFDLISRRFMDQCQRGLFRLCVSTLVEEELSGAPREVRDFVELAMAFAEPLPKSAEALELQRAYISAGVLGQAHEHDAMHVAIATVTQCDINCSWNFKHIVNFQRIPLYNAVNTLRGYTPIQINSPFELIGIEDGDSD